MRVKFTYSQEDLVDATLRFSARSKSLRALRHKRALWGALGACAVIFVLFRFSLIGALAGVIAAIIVLIIDPFLYDRQYRKNLRTLLRERYGDENEFICEVELTPERLKMIGPDSQSSAGWEIIEEVVSTNDSVDIFGRKAHGVIVRNRAFTSAEERQQFIDLAREYMKRARNTSKKA
jgi:hypothetical protein